MKHLKEESIVQHPPAIVMDLDNHAAVAPVYHSIKFNFDSYQALEDLFSGRRSGYLYARHSNPTVRQLELTLAKLQGREDCIALGSGIAALTSVCISLLKTGDHVVLFYECYAPVRYLVGNLLHKFGISYTLVHIDDHAAISKAIIKDKTKLILFETPTNPVLKIADIEFICEQARSVGAITALDATFAGIHNFGNSGVDLIIHSLTKFVVGFGDAMGGSIAGTKELLTQIRHDAIETGAVMSAQTAYEIQRSLKSYYLRIDKHNDNARKVAAYLHSHPKASCVRYPGDTQHPQYELAKKEMRDFGGVLSFDIGDSKQDMVRFLDRLQLIKLTGSLGSSETVIAPSQLFYARDLSAETAKRAGIRSNTVRLSLGLEDVADIVGDLAQALD